MEMSVLLPCPNQCNVLLIGGGGREHALAWKISQSPKLGKLYATHCDNGGIAKLALPCEEKWDPARVFFLQRWCDQHDINLIVVGPEVPLSEGIADELSTDSRLVFGPSKEGARIESDKSYAKELMRQASIPTADSRTFTDIYSAQHYLLRGLDSEFENENLKELSEEVSNYMDFCNSTERQEELQISDELQSFLDQREEPFVVKASGLAAGKGVIVCNNIGEAFKAVTHVMEDKAFGDAGNTILIEEFMSGLEVSVLALVDGETIWVLDLCQDHKQVGEGDEGPNTGGMGAYCPTTLMNDEMLNYVEREILVPAIDAMRREGIRYCGVLYAGLMLTTAGIKVLEFNCRFGDPEMQPLLTRFKGDLVDVLWRTSAGTLNGASIEFEESVSCCTVICSEGYPSSYEKGRVITGIEDAESNENVVVFHAGTDCTSGELKTSGGRVLGVTATAQDLKTARELTNAACDKIHFDGAFYRSDIGCKQQTPMKNVTTSDSVANV